jgi:hypothetical protein
VSERKRAAQPTPATNDRKAEINTKYAHAVLTVRAAAVVVVATVRTLWTTAVDASISTWLLIGGTGWRGWRRRITAGAGCVAGIRVITRTMHLAVPACAIGIVNDALRPFGYRGGHQTTAVSGESGDQLMPAIGPVK